MATSLRASKHFCVVKRSVDAPEPSELVGHQDCETQANGVCNTHMEAAGLFVKAEAEYNTASRLELSLKKRLNRRPVLLNQ